MQRCRENLRQLWQSISATYPFLGPNRETTPVDYIDRQRHRPTPARHVGWRVDPHFTATHHTYEVRTLLQRHWNYRIDHQKVDENDWGTTTGVPSIRALLPTVVGRLCAVLEQELEFGWQDRVKSKEMHNLPDLIANLLVELEKNGGEDSFINIK